MVLAPISQDLPGFQGEPHSGAGLPAVADVSRNSRTIHTGDIPILELGVLVGDNFCGVYMGWP